VAVDCLAADVSSEAIVSVNVLEHCRKDKGKSHRYRHLLTKRNGALCLFVPARSEFTLPLTAISATTGGTINKNCGQN